MIYEKFVKPAMIDCSKAVAHYAISSLFHEYGKATRVFAFTFEDEQRQVATTGKTKLAIGRTRIISEITEDADTFSYAILYMGEHNLIGGVRKFVSTEAYEAMLREIKEVYDLADFPQAIRLIDRHFGNSPYSLKSLFKDEQRRILDEILAFAREDLENRFRLITDRYAPLMKFLQGAGAPLPIGMQTAWDLTLHSEIRRQFQNGHTDVEHLKHLVDEARPRGSAVLNADISYAVKNKMERMINQIAENPCDVNQVRELEAIASLMMPLPIGLNLAEVQNTYWRLRQSALPELQRAAAEENGSSQNCLNEFLVLGERLGFARNAICPT
jgi:hypothetical protein